MDTEMKSLNVNEDDIEEGEAGPKGEPLAKDMKGGYGSPPSTRGVGAFNKSLFKSASAAKAGSPCDIKPEKKDSKLVWEDGRSSEEKPIDGFYGESPNDPDEDDEDKKKDVKKSFFASAELSKAEGTLYVPGSGPRAEYTQKRAKEAIAKRPGAGKVHLKTIEEKGDPQSVSTDTLGVTKTEEARQKRSSMSRFLGTEPPIPGEFKEVVGRGQRFRLRGGSRVPGATPVSDKKKDVKKSLFTSAELSKARGTSPKKAHPGAVDLPRPSATRGGWKESGEFVSHPSVPKDYDTTTGRAMNIHTGKKGRPGLLKLQTKGGWQHPIDVSEEAGMKKLAEKKEVSVEKMTPTVRSTVRRVAGLPEQKSAPKMKKSITELRYGAQPLRAFDINKSCGVCGRLTKSCGGNEASGCCEDCKKSMNSVRWHESHLA